ncbi:hypothetical protein Tco_1336238 [Tanacetum coccineum]
MTRGKRMYKEEKKQNEWRCTYKNEKESQNNEWRWTFGKAHGEKNEKELNTSRISYKDVIVGFQPTATHQKHVEDAKDIIEFQVKHNQMARLRKCWVGKIIKETASGNLRRRQDLTDIAKP